MSFALEALRENRDPGGQGTLRRRVVMDGEWQRIEYRQEDIEEAIALVAAKRLGFGR